MERRAWRKPFWALQNRRRDNGRLLWFTHTYPRQPALGPGIFSGFRPAHCSLEPGWLRPKLAGRVATCKLGDAEWNILSARWASLVACAGSAGALQRAR